MALSTRKQDAEKIEVPMSSMIDVVFLLLIYFVWTYQVEVPEAHLAVNLPGAPEETEPPPPQPPIEVQVYKNDYLLRGKVVTLGMIRRSFETIAEINEDVTVVIQVSEAAPTARLVHLLDTCQEVGLENLNVVTI